MSRTPPQPPPASGEGPIVLRAPSDARWLPHALAHFDAVLVDHAHCEKKAAAHALSLLQAYPELPGLPAQMARLAREEAAHLARVLQLMEARGLALGRDPGDPYAQALQRHMRHGDGERRLDRLLVSACIEARSCERLWLLAGALPEPGLRRFYAELARSEHGHQALFHRLALQAAGGDAGVLGARLDFWLEREAQAIAGVGVRAAVH